MTNFGRRPSEMLTSTYDTDKSGVVDDAEKLDGDTKAQVQDHTPQAHVHAYADEEHATQHEDGGDDEIDATGLVGRVNYVDRGDPAAVDFAINTATLDGSWNDLDMSSVVPAGTKAVLISVTMACMTANACLIFRKNGNSNFVNMAYVRTPASVLVWDGQLIIHVDSNRVTEYSGTNATWLYATIQVNGWFV